MKEFQYESRIPKARVAVLIGKKGEVKRQIEKATACKLTVDSQEGDVFIRGKDALGLYTTRNIVAAIGRGFNPHTALLLLRPNYTYEELNVNVLARTKKQLVRMKGRVIGSEGKARRLIEELTDTHISVYGKTVCIIGDIAGVGQAKKALESLLAGSPHSTIYTWLEKQRARRKQEEFGL